MAKQKNNIVMHSTRGMFGGQVVFKRRAGKSFVAAPPEVDENREPTARQQELQKRFRTSNAYAAAALKDPDIYNAYLRKAKRGQSAYNVAVRDALIAPSITVLTAQGYSGQPGNLIFIEAIDDFKVTSVKLSIHTADNQLVEEGVATVTGSGLSWVYTTTQLNNAVAGSRITATAIDLPANETSLEIIL